MKTIIEVKGKNRLERRLNFLKSEPQNEKTAGEL